MTAPPFRSLRDWKPLPFLFLCIAAFSSDVLNIATFFKNDQLVFGCLTLFCLLVPGYFGRSHLLKNKEFFEDYTITICDLKRTFLYVFCILTFPVFNVVFRATRLFRDSNPSNEKFGLQIDQVKSFFEDSPQLALQLFIALKKKPHPVQILAIVGSSLTVAVPNLRAFNEIKDPKLDTRLFSFDADLKARMQSFKMLAKYFAFYFAFVLISFTRAASIASICCFLSYNAVLVYMATFIVLRILVELAKLTIDSESLTKIYREDRTDIIANAFNILELTKDSIVIRSYAVFWMIFNVTTIGLILFQIQTETVSTSNNPISLWIAPSYQLISDWSDIFIVSEGLHFIVLVSLCSLNVFSCVLICSVKASCNKKLEEKKDNSLLVKDDTIVKSVTTETIKEMKTSVEGELSSDDAKDIWRPYNNSDHYESVQQKKSDQEGLSTMTYLMDPWDFVSDCANKMLVDKDMDKIDQFKFGEAKQLLLKIMMVFKPLIPEDRQFLEVFHRCKTHYEFLEKLEQERIEEAAKYEKPEENFLKKLKEEERGETSSPPGDTAEHQQDCAELGLYRRVNWGERWEKEVKLEADQIVKLMKSFEKQGGILSQEEKGLMSSTEEGGLLSQYRAVRWGKKLKLEAAYTVKLMETFAKQGGMLNHQETKLMSSTGASDEDGTLRTVSLGRIRKNDFLFFPVSLLLSPRDLRSAEQVCVSWRKVVVAENIWRRRLLELAAIQPGWARAIDHLGLAVPEMEHVEAKSTLHLLYKRLLPGTGMGMTETSWTNPGSRHWLYERARQADLRTIFQNCPQDLSLNPAGKSTLSTLLVFGHSAFPLLATADGNVAMAGAHFGKGRVVVLPHEDLLQLRPLVAGAAEWVSGSPSMIVKADPISRGWTKNGWQYVNPLERPNQPFDDMERVGREDLLHSQAQSPEPQVYITEGHYEDHCEDVVEYVRRGGGLVIAGHAWFWASQKDKGECILKTHPGNKIVTLFGIAFTRNTIKKQILTSPVRTISSPSPFHLHQVVKMEQGAVTEDILHRELIRDMDELRTEKQFEDFLQLISIIS